MTHPALLKFHIGPVQSFIESAKTVRDLWTGSYILSWLVVAAMKQARKLHAKVISPSITGNPILDRVEGRPAAYDVLTPCLPNHFEAEFPVESQHEIADQVVDAAQKEWKAIADLVRRRLHARFSQGCADWARDWDSQIASFFEMRCVVLPAGAEGDRITQLHTLMDAVRGVRHTPAYIPRPDKDEQFGMKCTLLGTFEQVGPAELQEARKYWEGLGGWGFNGTKLRKRERLCAVSLVKRFAWPAYFAKTPSSPGAIGIPAEELRFDDSATVAAKKWFAKVGLDVEKLRGECHRVDTVWSGQWLHAMQRNSRDADDAEDRCPESVGEKIRAAKNSDNPAPTYYATLMMDGDQLGELIKSHGVEYVSGRLSEFALKHVPAVVTNQNHSGELIYAGGDDVLAMLPTVAAFDCASELNRTYRASDVFAGIEKATVSAGLVVAHFKEDLRFALRHARDAEREAKNFGRNCLCIRIIRRSGEHTSVVVPWKLVAALQALVTKYIGAPNQPGPSDRWAYKLRELLPTIGAMPAIFESELCRQLRRLELPEAERNLFVDQIKALLTEYKAAMQPRKLSTSDIHNRFVTLCQSAAFLARGRDE